jgi:uridine phosphorylase
MFNIEAILSANRLVPPASALFIFGRVGRIIEALTRKINNDEPIIQPRRRKTDPLVGPDAIMMMIPSDLDHFVGMFQSGEMARFHMDFFELYQVRHGKNGSLTFTGPFLGAPQAVMGMEKIIALGAKKIWVLGWCGSLQPYLKIGDMVIPTAAISEEGTSQHYPIGDRTAETDHGLNQMLEKALKRKGHSAFKGMIWTTDAPYRETVEKVKEYQERVVLAVEMEMSALMTLAIFRKVRMAGLLVVSDELFDLKWHHGFSNPELKKSSRLAGEVFLDLLTS